MSIPENPGSRLERYLDVIATGQGVKPANPQTRIERYLDVIAGNTVIAPYADNLTPYSEDSGATQSNPFILEGTGTGNGEDVVDTGSFAQIKSKNGNTIVYNQLVDDDTETVTIPSGHIYYAVISGTASIGTSDGTAISVTGGSDVVIDLSLWFGATDNIPDELAGDPDLFGRYWQGSLDYNEGEPISADGEILISRGRNAWDEQTEVGSLDWSTGQPVDMSGRYRSKNYCACIPNATYYCKAGGAIEFCFYTVDLGYIGTTSVNNTTFTTPAGACFFKIVNTASETYGNDVTISLYYSGESGYDQYYPYQILQVVDTGSEVLYDYDEKTPDGTIYRNSTRLDLGSLTYIDPDANGRTRCTETIAVSLPATAYNQLAPVKSSKFIAITPEQWYDSSKEGITITCSGYGAQELLGITSPSFIGKTAAEIKTLLSGIYAEFQNNTPTTEQGTPFEENVAIDDFGTLEWQITTVPQGCTIYYPYDYKAAIDTLLNMVNGVIGDIVTSAKVPDAPTTDGTYVLTATVSDGTVTYSWQST